MRLKRLTSSVALVSLLLAGCNSLSPREEILQDCFERNGIDTSNVDPMVDGRGKIIVVSGVPDASPDLHSECLEEANQGL